VVKTLPKETVELIERPALPVTWISPQHFNNLITACTKRIFHGREEPLLNAAKQAMREDLSSFYKVFIKLLSPQFVIERGTKLWDTYNRDNGTVSSRRSGERSAEVQYSGIVTSFPEFWVWQRGCIIGILEQTGLKLPRATLVKGGGSLPDAVIEASWA
jgi:hypothetical protein